MKNNHYKELIKIGLNITYYQKEQRLTQEELAEKASISRNHLQRIESGYCASLNVLMDIADALDIPLCKLFEFRD